MAKKTGLSSQLFVAGYDLSGDVGSIQTLAPVRSAQLDVTGINASGFERIYSQVDGEIAFNAFFNDAAAAAHPVLAPKGASRQVMYMHGSAIGNMAAALVAHQINYDATRGADGSLTFDVQALGASTGGDWCEQLTAGKRTDTTATNGSSLNNGAATSNGLIAYLQVFSFTGTSVTVAVQSSSDNGGGDPFAAVLTFTAATGITTERKATASLTTAVEQYLRVATTGTFSNAVFAVAASRYAYAL